MPDSSMTLKMFATIPSFHIPLVGGVMFTVLLPLYSNSLVPFLGMNVLGWFIWRELLSVYPISP